MNLRKTLACAIVLALAVLYLLQIELPREGNGINGERLLGGLSGKEIKKIAIKVIGKEPVVFLNPAPSQEVPKDLAAPIADQGSGPKWKLEDLPYAELDQGALNAVLTSISSLSVEKPLPLEEIDQDMEVYGLGKPEVVIDIDSLKGQAQVRFGKENAYLNQRYYQIEGRPELYLGYSDLYQSARKEKDEFRSKTPITYDQTALKKIDIENARGTTTLEFRESEGWQITSPLKVKAGLSEVPEFLRRLRSLQVKKFIDPPAADDKKIYKLDSPEAKIVLKGKDGVLLREVQLSGVPGPEPKMYFQTENAPTVFEVEGDTMSYFTLTSHELRNKKPSSFLVPAVRKVLIEKEGGTSLTLERDESKEDWKVDGEAADPLFVRDFLKHASELTAAQFPNMGEELFSSSQSPFLKVTIDRKAPEKAIELIFGHPLKRGELGELYPLKVGEDEYLLAPEDFKQFDRLKEIFIKRPPLPGTPTPVASNETQDDEETSQPEEE